MNISFRTVTMACTVVYSSQYIGRHYHGGDIVQSSSLPPIKRCSIPPEEIRLPEWTNRTTNSSRSFVQSKGCLDLSVAGHLMIWKPFKILFVHNCIENVMLCAGWSSERSKIKCIVLHLKNKKYHQEFIEVRSVIGHNFFIFFSLVACVMLCISEISEHTAS